MRVKNHIIAAAQKAASGANVHTCNALCSNYRFAVDKLNRALVQQNEVDSDIWTIDVELYEAKLKSFAADPVAYHTAYEKQRQLDLARAVARSLGISFSAYQREQEEMARELDRALDHRFPKKKTHII